MSSAKHAGNSPAALGPRQTPRSHRPGRRFLFIHELDERTAIARQPHDRAQLAVTLREYNAAVRREAPFDGAEDLLTGHLTPGNGTVRSFGT